MDGSEAQTFDAADHAPHRAGELAARGERGSNPSLDCSYVLVQLEPGHIRISSTTSAIDGCHLRRTSTNLAALHRATVPPNCTALVMASSGSALLLINGRQLTHGHYVVVDGGSSIELVARASGSWLYLCVSDILLGEHVDKRSNLRADHPAGQVPIMLSNGICAAVEALASDAALEVETASPLERAVSIVIDALAVQETRRSCAGCHDSRRLAVERARRFIADRMCDPIRLGDLCAHARLSPRCLEYGFHDLMQLSPMAYLRICRLAKVRTHLLDVSDANQSISQLALDSGFFHLSQFVVDYKRMFGETPSFTRRNARDRLGVESPLRARRHRTPRRDSPSLHHGAGRVGFQAGESSQE